MIRFLISTAVYLAANAIGLLLAVWILPEFTITAMSFVIAVAIFSLVQAIVGPIITKLSIKSFPQLMGGIALVTIFIGLYVTQLLVAGMEIGGIANWLAATLLVWIGSLAAGIILPIYVFKEAAERVSDTTRREIEEQVRKEVEQQVRHDGRRD